MSWKYCVRTCVPTVEREKDEKIHVNLQWPFAFSSLAKSCGFDLPAPVLSSSAMMLVVFHSDETETFGGFRATVSFVHVTGNRSNLGNCLWHSTKGSLVKMTIQNYFALGDSNLTNCFSEKPVLWTYWGIKQRAYWVSEEEQWIYLKPESFILCKRILVHFKWHLLSCEDVIAQILTVEIYSSSKNYNKANKSDFVRKISHKAAW